MGAKLRVTLASVEHDHVWGELRHWLSHPDVEVVAMGDADPRLRQKALDAGVPKAYDSWQELLEKEPADIVQVSSDNATTADITEAAMAAGAHVVTEKPMAATLAQADRMIAAMENHGKRLMVNWPNIWGASFQEWERLILSGAIGRVTHLKHRSAHNGPKEIGCDPAFVAWLYDETRNGAGAFMDYCCYGANIAARFLGRPNRVMGMRGTLAKTYPVPDDNGIVVCQYDQALTIAEGSWTDIAGVAAPSTLAYGTEGAVWIDGARVGLHQAGKDIEWITPEPPAFPRQNAPQYFLHCLATGAELEGGSNPIVSRNAQEILQSGLDSARSGSYIQLG